MLKLLCAGHHAANVVDTASVVGSDGVGVSMVVGIGGVGDGSHGGGGLSSLHLDLGDNSTSSQVGVGTVGVRVGGVGDGRGGDGYRGNDGLLMNVGNGNVAGGVMNIGESGGGLVAIRDRAGEGQGNGGQEN